MTKKEIIEKAQTDMAILNGTIKDAFSELRLIMYALELNNAGIKHHEIKGGIKCQNQNQKS